ncbi:MAG TPA: hypothetical protein VMR14_09875 [Streptosporangiaceae bacterium]|jgi:hypothetical protein|nr:hypothetical protein [Streptosporangiaceae bacterium]
MTSAGRFTPLDLDPYANCVGIEPACRPGAGGFNIWRNTFPAEELPAGGSMVTVGAVPFRFPAADGVRADNIRCRGQLVTLPGTRVDWLYLLGAAERRTEDALTVCYAGGACRRQWLRMSDFWPETDQWFGELLAYRTTVMLYPQHAQDRMAPSIWRQRVPVTVPDGAVGVALPDNPAMHIFALTLLDEEAS